MIVLDITKQDLEKKKVFFLFKNQISQLLYCLLDDKDKGTKKKNQILQFNHETNEDNRYTLELVLP